MAKSETMPARIRLWCFFRVKDLDEGQYGLTVIPPHFVEAPVRQGDRTRISVFGEGLWWDRQDRLKI
jgi:hypothetical protein